MQIRAAGALPQRLSPLRQPEPKRRPRSAELGAGKRSQLSAATIPLLFPAGSPRPPGPLLRKPSQVAKPAGGSLNNQPGETRNANAPLPVLLLPQKRSIRPRRDADA